MKTAFFTIYLLFSTSLFSQFVKEHTYPGAGNVGISMGTQQLYLVKLEVAGEKYVHVDRANKKIDLYNLNHTLYTSMSFTGAIDVNPNSNNQDILYISQHLFDTDNDIEYMYLDQFFSSSGASLVTHIINDDGTILFTENNAGAIVRLNVPQGQQPIYNTTAGTKMILSITNGDANVYSLTGTLTVNVASNNIVSTGDSQLFPNPSNKSVTISNSEPFNVIEVYNAEGKNVLSSTLNETTSHDLDISLLPAGSYFVQTRDQAGHVTGGKRLIKN